jgi:hypothetical protein
MSLELQECIEIIFVCGHDGWSHRQVAVKFNSHPERNPVTHSSLDSVEQSPP